MTFDLDNIQRMWEEDAKIDPDNLHTESLNIPVLHARYYDMYNNIIPLVLFILSSLSYITLLQ